MSTTTPQTSRPTPSDPGWPGRRMLVAIIVIALAVLLIVHYAGGGRDGQRLGHRADHTPALAADGQSQARLVVSGGTDRLTVTTDDLGADLVQAETPSGQSAVPILQETEQGTVAVSTRADDAAGGAGTDLTVRLARDVRWEISVEGGTSLLRLDLDRARVQSLDVTQGVAAIEAKLPRPEGILRTRVSGGANTVRVVVPPQVPVQATFSGGAGSANLDGVQHDGLSGGEVLFSPEDTSDLAEDRIELMMDSGIGSLALARQG